MWPVFRLSSSWAGSAQPSFLENYFGSIKLSSIKWAAWLSFCLASPHPKLSAGRGCILIAGLNLDAKQQRSPALRWWVFSLPQAGVRVLVPPPRKHRHRYFGVLAPNSPWRSKWCSKVWRRGRRGGARIGVDQSLVWCGEWCGLPNPDCRHCAFFACSAYQISPTTKQKRSMAMR